MVTADAATLPVTKCKSDVSWWEWYRWYRLFFHYCSTPFWFAVYYHHLLLLVVAWVAKLAVWFRSAQERDWEVHNETGIDAILEVWPSLHNSSNCSLLFCFFLIRQTICLRFLVKGRRMKRVKNNAASRQSNALGESQRKSDAIDCGRQPALKHTADFITHTRTNRLKCHFN